MEKIGCIATRLDLFDAVRNHPGLQDAVRAAAAGLIDRYGRNGLPNRLANDRGRVLGGLGALYLHFAPPPGSTGLDAGLTAARFQAVCSQLKLCSPGRARALLALMRYAGYLVAEPDRTKDRRQRRLLPTERLIEQHRQRWTYHFEAMALVLPETGRDSLALLGRLEFTASFVRHLGAMYFAGFRPLHFAPDLRRIVESNAGVLVIAALFLAATDGRPSPPEGTIVPMSISALAARFGIARTHVRRLLADAAEAGLLQRSSGSETVIVLPRLTRTVGDLFAAIFALQAHCAQAAAEEIARARETDALAGSDAPGKAEARTLASPGRVS